ncbi:MAG: hypothetical protein N3E51_03635 [Candidatus Micrarchaeota archaeon]|nr:hypothetical protein [Candidatus Micrarchaeota archaeon]
MKKGIMTIATMLLCAALLALVSAIAFHSSALRFSSARLSQLEDASQQYDSAAHAFISLASAGPANVSIVGNNVSISHNISSLPAYRRDIARLASFISGHSTQDIVLNTTYASRPAMLIQPQEVAIDGFGSKLSFTPENSGASAGNLSAYRILLLSSQPTPSFFWNNLSSEPPSSQNATLLYAGFQGSNGTVWIFQSLHKHQYSELRLLSASNQSLASIYLQSPAALTVSYDSSAIASILATLSFNSTVSAVELGNTLINIAGVANLSGPATIR